MLNRVSQQITKINRLNHVRYYSSTIVKNGISDVKLNDQSKDSKSYIDMHDKVIMNTYGRVTDFVVTHGKGSYLYDMKGDKYLDFGAGIAVNALGHSEDHWVEVLSSQAKKVTHLSNLYYNQPAIELAQSLISNSKQFDKVFFTNSGTESNEAALKFAKKYGISKSPEKYEIIAFTQGFSGRSMGALSCTYKQKYREIYGPLLPGVHFAKYNDIESVRKLVDKNKTAAIIIEPVQGEGGLEAASVDFMKSLYELCQQNDVVLIVDEVQCGIGRTGRLWAHERFLDVCKPDIMTLAKPLAGGLPIGAVLVTDKIANVMKPGDHGTTFGGGPLITKVGGYVFNKIAQKEFLDSVNEKGKYLLNGLETLQRKYPTIIKELRSTGGLFIGLELSHPVKDFIKQAHEKDKILLISAGDNTIRLCPPLNISKDEIDQVLGCIENYLQSYKQ
ncbi:acetylornithine transaminase [Tieghemostelium lacteum]|uniref:acetylornithine transaminase n=1 Tax=Tieghemostelium lacteum TaxID=361077 RepID=A0A152A7A9_TIELA|nr:acetylornithine transaminase [Tieghemostelium lacteum]|eukprot:KYR02133.1 acetylornithine transaminase [Tieghemostelium lacteum]